MKNKPYKMANCPSRAIDLRVNRNTDLKCLFTKIQAVRVIFLVLFFGTIFSSAIAGDITKKTESVKLTRSQATNTPSLSLLYINMYSVKPDGTLLLADGIASAYYTVYHNAVDGQDAPKLNSFNTKEALCIIRDGVQLSIEKREPISQRDTTFLQVIQMDERRYQFQFDARGFNPLLTAYLKDEFTGTATPINLQMTDTTKYTFDINATTPGSREVSRFSVVFGPVGELPVNFSSVNAFEQNRSVNVEWKVENEINISQYNIEKSVNGIQFSEIGTLAPSQITSLAKQYTWVDFKPENGTNFYRIKYMNKDGGYAYSKIVKIMLNSTSSGVKVYPTVIENGNMDVQFVNMKKGSYNLRMINTNGQVIFSKSINHFGGNATQNILVENKSAKGIYQLNILGPDNFFNSVKLLNR